MPDSTDQRNSHELDTIDAETVDAETVDAETVDPRTIDQKAIDAVLRIGGVALLERLVDVAEGNVRDRLKQLDEALAARPPDRQVAERAAHSLKSSAAYLGAEALRRQGADMELDAAEGRLDQLPAKLAEARRLLEIILPVLRREVEVQRNRDCA